MEKVIMYIIYLRPNDYRLNYYLLLKLEFNLFKKHNTLYNLKYKILKTNINITIYFLK